uniref:Uncharacterized protein n=2 Tax=Heterorhabditis bacteriophora TaxID=37862 RepID=A0A1I7WCP8_HETBA
MLLKHANQYALYYVRVLCLTMRKIEKLGKWVLHELSEDRIGRRLNSCISLHVTQRNKNFLWEIVTGVDSGQPTTSKIHSVHLVGHEECAVL